MRITRNMAKEVDRIVERDKALAIDGSIGSIFPEEIMFCIAEYLDKKTVIRLRVVSRAFLRAAKIRAATDIATPESLNLKLRKKYRQLSKPDYADRIQVIRAKLSWYSDNDRKLVFNLMARSTNIKLLHVDLPRMLSDPVSSGMWDGRFQHLAVLSIHGPASSLVKFHLSEVRLPRLEEFKYVSKFSFMWFSNMASNEAIIEGVLAEFLNRHSPQLQSLELRFSDTIGDITDFTNKLGKFPRLKVLRLAGQWRAGELDDEQRLDLDDSVKFCLQTLVEKHIEQLSEVCLAPNDRRRIENSQDLVPRIFEMTPTKPYNLTSVKLGVYIDMSPMFFSWLAPLLPKLHSLWLSRPLFDEVTPHLDDLISMMEDVKDLPLRDLLLHSGEPTNKYILKLHHIFPRLQFLRLLFSTLVADLSAKKQSPEGLKRYSSTVCETYNRIKWPDGVKKWPQHLFIAQQHLTDPWGKSFLELSYHIHLDNEGCECQCEDCTGGWPMGFELAKQPTLTPPSPSVSEEI